MKDLQVFTFDQLQDIRNHIGKGAATKAEKGNLSELKKVIDKGEIELASLKEKINNLRNYEDDLKRYESEIKKRIEPNETKIHALRMKLFRYNTEKSNISSSNHWWQIFKDKEPEQRRLEQLRSEIWNTEEEIRNLSNESCAIIREVQTYMPQPKKSQYEKNERNLRDKYSALDFSVNFAKKYYEIGLNRLDKITAIQEGEKIKQREKELLLKSKAAKNIQETRALAKQVRIKHNGSCPYCGVAINYKEKGSYELEHIYPVSKGGKSTSKNMVYTCKQCNQTKRNLTLQSCIKKYNWDRAAIEARLDELGKEY